MFKNKWFYAVSLFVALALVGASFTPVQAQEAGTIVDIAVADGRFDTLVAAVSAAGLAETLSGEGPFTVFAPTDAAFSRLPEGTVEALLNDIPTLTDILLYHVVSGEVMAEQALELGQAETLQGQSVDIIFDEGNILIPGGLVYVNDARIRITDIQASNGVIHVIDRVILPSEETEEESMGTIVDIAVANGSFETLVAALDAADLVETLSGEGPFTVFAPTDDAFAKLSEGTVEALLNDIPTLTNILLYHVVSGEVLAEQVVGLEEAQTVLGENVSVRVEDGNVYINDSMAVLTDIMADNGVIHVIDTVLLPPEN
jgi:uncharacterized surface protein with fasciclin (FAS1) repeats